MSRPTLRQVRDEYDRLRLLYFQDPPSGQFKLPLGKRIKFSWMAGNDAMALTLFGGPKGTVDEMQFHPYWATRWLVFRQSLIHEMTHVRLGYDVSCGARSDRWRGPRIPVGSAWHRETVRLARLGALQM